MFWNSNNNSNKFKQTYFNGFVDISGGDMIMQNHSIKSDYITSNNNNLYIGTDLNCNNIHLGSSSTNIYIDGITTNVETNNITVNDNCITLSKNGVNCGGSGFEIEENNSIQSYIKLSTDKTVYNVLMPYDTNIYNMITTKNLANSISNTDNFIITGLCNNTYVIGGDLGVGGNTNIGGNLSVGNNITCTNLNLKNIKCDSLNCNNYLYYKNQSAGFLVTNTNLNIPLMNSINDISICYTNLNLQNILLTTGNNCYVFLNPFYKLVFYNNNNILCIIDNTINTTILYKQITFNYSFLCTKIIIQYNNITI